MLDLPCGTGQSLPALVEAVGRSGLVLGVDASSGMLRKAERRIARAGWGNVVLRRATAKDVDAEFVRETIGDAGLDGVLCALGLTALPQWEAAFEQLFSLLRAGGRFVLFDVFAAVRTGRTRSVEMVARADLSREAWRPLEACSTEFTREVLPADPKVFGGELYVAAGTKPSESRT